MAVSNDAFLNEPAQPTEEMVTRLLGPAKEWWDSFLKEITGAGSDATPEWRFYKGKTGWRMLACKGGRNLAYLKPAVGSFLVSTAVSDGVLDTAQGEGVPKAFIKSVRESKLLPEGRAARVEVKSAKDLKTVLKLVACKARER